MPVPDRLFLAGLMQVHDRLDIPGTRGLLEEHMVIKKITNQPQPQ
jgi:hypothetical protein